MPKKKFCNGTSNGIVGFFVPVYVLGIVIGIVLSLISIPLFGFRFAKILACVTLVYTVFYGLPLFYCFVSA